MNARDIIHDDLYSFGDGEVKPDELYEFIDYCNGALFGTEPFYLPDEPAPRALDCRATMDIIRHVAADYR